jgi:menaquinone-dependent protoporphyrinogen oxidase
MPRFLVVYSSTHGHTAKIAASIADTLRADGATVELEAVEAAPVPADFDAVVVGASIHAGHHQREMRDWVKLHRTSLGIVPSRFFTVCLTMAEDTEESREATRTYVDEFLEATGWSPDRPIAFAGALQYLEYDFATRLVVRLLMKQMHRPTDASRDYDYTDWDAVERFAHECAQLPAASGAAVHSA